MGKRKHVREKERRRNGKKKDKQRGKENKR